MENNVNFFIMKPEDLEEVIEIEKLSFSTPWTKEGFLEALEKDYCCFIVARMGDGMLAGYCGFYQTGEEADIINVAVSPKVRNQGIGFKMINHLIKLGSERNILDYTLEVRRGNTLAIRLYEKCGFEGVGYRKNFYRNPTEDAYIMWRYH